ncbi:zinc finger (CCCH type) motif-containing protein [Besnoitia besnoiti]|uniref:Zinc finger (CCCH type) motif-containing protein n=1 Tax=Besnoitia besnoiti TaxID=94643 RepID=A0A2A9M0Y8_BESBE|nr:zinc finger (CCCH type) motif-containing protein [Besnoitia besnoiti]PFH31645.1 zinc finger (CCCH type) motif-containing protein [Besnoitia besnoiti]
MGGLQGETNRDRALCGRSSSGSLLPRRASAEVAASHGRGSEESRDEDALVPSFGGVRHQSTKITDKGAADTLSCSQDICSNLKALAFGAPLPFSEDLRRQWELASDSAFERGGPSKPVSRVAHDSDDRGEAEKGGYSGGWQQHQPRRRAEEGKGACREPASALGVEPQQSPAPELKKSESTLLEDTLPLGTSAVDFSREASIPSAKQESMTSCGQSVTENTHLKGRSQPASGVVAEGACSKGITDCEMAAGNTGEAEKHTMEDTREGDGLAPGLRQQTALVGGHPKAEPSCTTSGVTPNENAGDLSTPADERRASTGGDSTRRAGGGQEDDAEGVQSADCGRRESGGSSSGNPIRLVRAYSQYYKTKMCLYVVQGRVCARGSKCVYAHSEDELREPPNLEKTRLCPAFKQTGSCTNQETCAYAHSSAELRHTVTVFKTKICHMWNKGKCGAGTACRHAHGLEELKRHRQRSQQELVALSRGGNLQPESKAVEDGAWHSSHIRHQTEETTAKQVGDQKQVFPEVESMCDASGSVHGVGDTKDAKAEPREDHLSGHIEAEGGHRLPQRQTQAADQSPAPKERRSRGGRRAHAAGVEAAGLAGGRQLADVVTDQEKGFLVTDACPESGASERATQCPTAAQGKEQHHSECVPGGLDREKVHSGHRSGHTSPGCVSDRGRQSPALSSECKAAVSRYCQPRPRNRKKGVGAVDSSGRAETSEGGMGQLDFASWIGEQLILAGAARDPGYAVPAPLTSEARLPQARLPAPQTIRSPPRTSQPAATWQMPEYTDQPNRTVWQSSGVRRRDQWDETTEQVPAALAQYLSALLASRTTGFPQRQEPSSPAVSDVASAAYGVVRGISAMAVDPPRAVFPHAGSDGNALQGSTCERQAGSRVCANFGSVPPASQGGHGHQPSASLYDPTPEQGSALIELLLGFAARGVSADSTQGAASIAESRIEQPHHDLQHRETGALPPVHSYGTPRSPENWGSVQSALTAFQPTHRDPWGAADMAGVASAPAFPPSGPAVAEILELLMEQQSRSQGVSQSAMELLSRESVLFPPSDGGGFARVTGFDAPSAPDGVSGADESGNCVAPGPRGRMMRGDQPSPEYFPPSVAPSMPSRTAGGNGLPEYPMVGLPRVESFAPQGRLSTAKLPVPHPSVARDGFYRGSSPAAGAYFSEPPHVRRLAVVAEQGLSSATAPMPFRLSAQGSHDARTDTRGPPGLSRGIGLGGPGGSTDQAPAGAYSSFLGSICLPDSSGRPHTTRPPEKGP